MFDFPNAPTTNQVVTGPNGAGYRWDGVKWAANSQAPGTVQSLTAGAGITLTPNPIVATGTVAVSVPLTLNANAAALPGVGAGVLLHLGAADGQNTGVTFDSFGSAGGTLVYRTAGGAAAAPSATQSTGKLGFVQFYGYGTSYAIGAMLQCSPLENWSASAQGASLEIDTVTAGTTNFLQRMQIRQGVVIGNTSADPGQGGLTLNANTAALPAAPYGQTLLHSGAADGQQSTVVVDAFGAVPAIFGRQSGGTAAAQTASPNGIALLQVMGVGYTGSGYAGGANIQFATTQTWGAGALGSQILFSTIPNGSATSAVNMTLDGSGNLNVAGGYLAGTTPGGFKGAGTVNAGAYFVNGSNCTPGQIQAYSGNPSTVPAHVGSNQHVGLGYTFHTNTSTRMLVVLNGSVANDTANATCSALLRYGTGTPPINGQAATGTQVMGIQFGSAMPAGMQTPCPLIWLFTGLTIGTQYWVDVVMSFSTGTGDYFQVSYNFIEV